MMAPRFVLLLSTLGLAAACSSPTDGGGDGDAQGTPPPCSAGSCACDDLFAPVSACFDVPIPADAQGVLPCVVVEASDTAPCVCSGPGRSPVAPTHMCAVSSAMAASTMTWSCFCEVTQTQGADRTSCQDDPQPVASAEGWCYLDDSAVSPVGNPALLATCPAGEKHALRFVGAGAPGATASLFIACGQ
jgi:hypothetical protein